MISPSLRDGVGDGASEKRRSTRSSELSEGSTLSAPSVSFVSQSSKKSLSSRPTFTSKASGRSSSVFSKATTSASSLLRKSLKLVPTSTSSSGASSSSAKSPGPAECDYNEIYIGDHCEAVSRLIARRSPSLESHGLADLPMGTAMVVLDKCEGRRIKVRVAAGGRDSPIAGLVGWVSTRTRMDEPLVVRCAPDMLFATADFDPGGRHEVKSAVTVRVEESLDSEVICELQPGAVVRIRQLGRSSRRRVKVFTTDRIEGWISAVTRKGEPLLGKVGSVSKSDQKTIEKSKALLDSVRKGDLTAVRKTAEKSGGIFAKLSSSGRCPLVLSIGDARGKTPLIYASACGRKDIVEYLLLQGVDVGAVDDTQKSALHHAARRGNREAGVNDEEGRAYPPTVADAHAEIVQILLQHGACIDGRDHNGCTPLMFAVANGRGPVTRELLTSQADLNVKDHEGHQPLDYALHYGHREIAALLRGAGASQGRRGYEEEEALESDVQCDSAPFDAPDPEPLAPLQQPLPRPSEAKQPPPAVASGAAPTPGRRSKVSKNLEAPSPGSSTAAKVKKKGGIGSTGVGGFVSGATRRAAHSAPPTRGSGGGGGGGLGSSGMVPRAGNPRPPPVAEEEAGAEAEAEAEGCMQPAADAGSSLVSEASKDSNGSKDSKLSKASGGKATEDHFLVAFTDSGKTTVPPPPPQPPPQSPPHPLTEYPTTSTSSEEPEKSSMAKNLTGTGVTTKKATKRVKLPKKPKISGKHKGLACKSEDVIKAPFEEVQQALLELPDSVDDCSEAQEEGDVSPFRLRLQAGEVLELRAMARGQTKDVEAFFCATPVHEDAGPSTSPPESPHGRLQTSVAVVLPEPPATETLPSVPSFARAEPAAGACSITSSTRASKSGKVVLRKTSSRASAASSQRPRRRASSAKVKGSMLSETNELEESNLESFSVCAEVPPASVQEEDGLDE